MLCQFQLWKYQSTCLAVSNSSSLNHIPIYCSNIQLMLLLWKKNHSSLLNLTEKAVVEAYLNSLESCSMMLELSSSSPCALSARSPGRIIDFHQALFITD